MESVRWNQHSTHLTHSVSELYKNYELTDCILDVEGQSVYVHKIILAACSPYFKNLLKNDPAIALIPMKDVSYRVMKLILEFVYYGEANVYITDVYSLIKTAELFEMTSLKHIVRQCFQIELPCKDKNAWSMEDGCSVSFTNLMRHDTMNLREEQVPLVPAILHTRAARLTFNSQSSSVHAIGDSSAKHFNNFQDLTGKSNKDQSKSDTPNTCDSLKKNANEDKENVSEELVPLAFVAVSEIKEPNEGHQEDMMCFDSVLEDPLGEYSGILGDTEETSVKQEFTFQSEVQVKKETEDDNDVPKSMAGDVLISEKLTHSFLELTSTKCNPYESCDQESGIDMNPHQKLSDRFGSEDCTSDKTHDLEVKFESICEISGADVKEKKIFGTFQNSTHTVGDNAGTVLLEPESELLNCDVQHFSSTYNQQDGNEEDCDSSTSKVITRFALEFGIKTPAMNETPASSFTKTIFGEEGQKLKKKMKERDISCHDHESLISRKQINIQPLKLRDHLHQQVKHQFRDRNDEVRKVQTHSTKLIKFSCNICSKSFRNVRHLRTHMTTHNGEKEFHFKISQNSFHRKGHLARHVRTHFGTQHINCQICNKPIGSKYYLRIHMRMHSGDRQFECEICNKAFLVKGALNQHMRTHSGDRPFECEICNKTFFLKGNLNRHMKTHSGDRPFECEICKKTFSRKESLNVHFHNHTGNRPFECEICYKTFFSKGNLKQHMGTHTGDRPFECVICKKTYTQKGRLNVHFRTHTGNRPFECEICDRTFFEKGLLNQHMRTHSGDRPFECGICKKTFSRKGTLNRHMNTHSGDRSLPYPHT